MKKYCIFLSILMSPMFNTAIGQAPTGLAECAIIDAAAARLACYDKLAEDAGVRPAPGTAAAPPPRPVTPPAAVATEPAARTAPRSNPTPQAATESREARRGSDNARSDDNPRERSYIVVAANHTDFTGWTIDFGEGGTWRQVGTDDYDIVVGERYTVRRTAFGFYQLGNADNNKKIRIRQVD